MRSGILMPQMRYPLPSGLCAYRRSWSISLIADAHARSTGATHIWQIPCLELARERHMA